MASCAMWTSDFAPVRAGSQEAADHYRFFPFQPPCIPARRNLDLGPTLTRTGWRRWPHIALNLLAEYRSAGQPSDMDETQDEYNVRPIQ
jgi:hypothetical protein